MGSKITHLYDASQRQTSKRTSASYKASNKAWLEQRKAALEKKKSAEISKRGPLKRIENKSGLNVIPSAAEARIRTVLNGYDFLFHSEASFAGCISPKGYPLRFDFYIPKYRLVIEYNGKAYHKAESVKQRDQIKKDFCRMHKLKLYIFKAKHWPDLETHIIRVLARFE